MSDDHSAPVAQALRELVELKDLEDMVDMGLSAFASFEDRRQADAELDRRYPAAWEAARAALSHQPVGSVTPADVEGASPCGGPGSTLQPPAAASAAIPGAEHES